MRLDDYINVVFNSAYTGSGDSYLRTLMQIEIEAVKEYLATEEWQRRNK